MLGCPCPVCRSGHPRNDRLRASIVLRDGTRTILVDCGSDFRQQALRHNIDRLDAILLTHAHSDHVSGLDDIRSYNWLQQQPIPIYASEGTWESLRRRFDYIFTPPAQIGGGVPEIDARTVNDDDPFDVLGLRVQPLPVMHGALPVLGFRFGDFAYITDASHVPESTIQRLRGVRTFILNALRHRPHPTHLNIEQAVGIAQLVGAGRTWFTHITHDLDHDETNAGLPPGIELGFDGLEFECEA